MSESRTYFVARTSLGKPIETFETRAQALAWIEVRSDLFPGWSIAKVTERLVIDTLVIRRDRSSLSHPQGVAA